MVWKNRCGIDSNDNAETKSKLEKLFCAEFAVSNTSQEYKNSAIPTFASTEYSILF